MPLCGRCGVQGHTAPQCQKTFPIVKQRPYPMEETPIDKQKELNQNNNINNLQEYININDGKLKSKEVQALLTYSKKQKELIHNLEINYANKNDEILVQNNEANICPLDNQEMTIDVEPIMRPIIETNEPSLGLTIVPILESLKKVAVPTLRFKPRVKGMKNPPKL